jgi:thiol-disulfide isomerase/thioredoxin
MNRRLVVLAGAGLAAAAIGAGTAWRRARQDAEDSVAPVVSIDIWALEFQSVDGAPIKMASWRGRPLLLNFWATWCGPCRAEIPALVDLQQQYGDQLVVLGVSIDDPLNKLKPYATEMHMNYPVLVGKDRQDVQDAYGPLWGIPVSVFVDREGKVWKRHSGIASKDQFEREIKALL